MKINTISQWSIARVVFGVFAIIAIFIIGSQLINLASTTSSTIDEYGANGSYSNTTVEIVIDEDTVLYDNSGRFN